jgi:hypothetical protein
MDLSQSETSLTQDNDTHLFVENDIFTSLEQSLIKIYRGYLMSTMSEFDSVLERAEMFDSFLKIKIILGKHRE